MYDDVLIATDGSEGAGAAADYAFELAERYGARLHAVCVVNPYDCATVVEREEREERARETVDGLAERAGDAGIEATAEVRIGFPHEELVGYATERADLVVMGTHGRSGVQRFLLGSVAEKVVRLSPVPVLTVRTGMAMAEATSFDTVLAPTDGSDPSRAAEDHAVDIASTYGAALHALGVVETAALGPDVRSLAVDSLEEAAQRAVDGLLARAEEAGVDATGHVEEGTPHAEILAAIDEYGVDLVVMGTHGRSGIEQFVLGSVAEKVVRAAEVPVLTVHAGEENPLAGE